jgi:hypothetical protein
MVFNFEKEKRKKKERKIRNKWLDGCDEKLMKFSNFQSGNLENPRNELI